MRDRTMEEALLAAQKGDLLGRENLIKQHREFILKISSRICNRFLSWDNDDELSVALLAFNEAIDKYNPCEGVHFHYFARKVIHNRLVDYFRKEVNHKHIHLITLDNQEEEFNTYDVEYSYTRFQEESQQNAFGEVVEVYMKELENYGVTLDDLIKVSPRHRDTKKTLMTVADKLTNEPALLEYLYTQKMLPLKQLELLTGVKRKVLERGRKYLIALTLILSDPKYSSLKSFTEMPE